MNLHVQGIAVGDHATEQVLVFQGAGYRHPRHDLPEITAALLAVFEVPGGLMAGAESVGDPIAVLPVLFHLLWHHRLHADVSIPLSPYTEVVSEGAGDLMVWLSSRRSGRVRE